MRSIVLILATAFSLSACSSNYGMYSTTDPKNDEFGYLPTYLVVAATIVLAGALDDDDSGSGGSGRGGY